MKHNHSMILFDIVIICNFIFLFRIFFHCQQNKSRESKQIIVGVFIFYIDPIRYSFQLLRQQHWWMHYEYLLFQAHAHRLWSNHPANTPEDWKNNICSWIILRFLKVFSIFSVLIKRFCHELKRYGECRPYAVVILDFFYRNILHSFGEYQSNIVWFEYSGGNFLLESMN